MKLPANEVDLKTHRAFLTYHENDELVMDEVNGISKPDRNSVLWLSLHDGDKAYHMHNELHVIPRDDPAAYDALVLEVERNYLRYLQRTYERQLKELKGLEIRIENQHERIAALTPKN